MVFCSYTRMSTYRSSAVEDLHSLMREHTYPVCWSVDKKHQINHMPFAERSDTHSRHSTSTSWVRIPWVLFLFQSAWHHSTLVTIATISFGNFVHIRLSVFIWSVSECPAIVCLVVYLSFVFGVDVCPWLQVLICGASSCTSVVRCVRVFFCYADALSWRWR